VGAMRTSTTHLRARQPAETRPHLTSPYEGEASERGTRRSRLSPRLLTHSISGSAENENLFFQRLPDEVEREQYDGNGGTSWR